MKASKPSSSSRCCQDAPVTVICADWLLPVLSAPVAGGALAVRGNRIIDFGPTRKILTEYSGAQSLQLPGAIMPGMVNAHTHLELSCLPAGTPPAANVSFVDWIRELLSKRGGEAPGSDRVIAAADAVLRQQRREGVVAVADVGNEAYVELDDADCADWPLVYRMLEVLAPQQTAADMVLTQLAAADENNRVTCHAPYSTVPAVLTAVKDRCRRHGHLFSIHTAESPDEYEFVSHHSGSFREFLDERKSWDGSFDQTGQRDEGTVEYLHRLKLLDRFTLLVHCVHVSDKELDIIAETGAHVCLCPASNQFLHVGKAPVRKMLRKGILPALGTDSVASNESLSIWHEIELLARQNDELPAELILGMATLGGARALHLDDRFGSLDIGKTAQFLSIQDDFACTARSGEELAEALVKSGGPRNMQWLRVD